MDLYNKLVGSKLTNSVGARGDIAVVVANGDGGEGQHEQRAHHHAARAARRATTAHTDNNIRWVLTTIDQRYEG